MRFLEIIVTASGLESELAHTAQFSVAEDEHYFTVDAACVHAKIRKRHADPRTYCHQKDDKSVVLGYGALNPDSSNEFLRIIISVDGTVSVERDYLTTLPIFYGASGGVFALSNEYELVASALPSVTLNHKRLLATLEPDPDSYETIWDEIKILGERQMLTYSG